MLKTEVRSGAYYDSVILMQLQRGLATLPGIDDAGVVMGTPANKDVLAQSGLLTPAAQDAGASSVRGCGSVPTCARASCSAWSPTR